MYLFPNFSIYQRTANSSAPSVAYPSNPSGIYPSSVVSAAAPPVHSSPPASNSTGVAIGNLQQKPTSKGTGTIVSGVQMPGALTGNSGPSQLPVQFVQPSATQQQAIQSQAQQFNSFKTIQQNASSSTAPTANPPSRPATTVTPTNSVSPSLVTNTAIRQGAPTLVSNPIPSVINSVPLKEKKNTKVEIADDSQGFNLYFIIHIKSILLRTSLYDFNLHSKGNPQF
jgi:hypothetical protein